MITSEGLDDLISCLSSWEAHKDMKAPPYAALLVSPELKPKFNDFVSLLASASMRVVFIFKDSSSMVQGVILPFDLLQWLLLAPTAKVKDAASLGSSQAGSTWGDIHRVEVWARALSTTGGAQVIDVPPCLTSRMLFDGEDDGMSACPTLEGLLDQSGETMN